MGEDAERKAREEGLRQGRQDALMEGMEKEQARLALVVERLSESLIAIKIKLAGLSVGAAGGAVGVAEIIRAWGN